MRLRLVLSGVVLTVLAANPGFAKESRAHHSTRASATNTGASGKGTSSANQTPGKPGARMDAGETIPPPVLPPHGVTQHQLRITNPSAKVLVNAPHSQAGVVISTPAAVRNAIGQPTVVPKNLVGAQPGVSPAQRTSGVISPPVVSSGTVHLNVATANHGSINGATAVRRGIAPPGIGGPAQAHYGINGTTVQNRH